MSDVAKKSRSYGRVPPPAPETVTVIVEPGLAATLNQADLPKLSR